MISGAMLLAGLAVADAKRGNCYIGGDPHIRGFDQTRGWTHHPVMAPGAWWLVHTESGEFQAQAMYSQCGRRTGGGWQGWKKHYNTSAHCMESLSLGGSKTDNKALTIQPPCTWNWGDMTCSDCTADRFPRVQFNGEKVELTNNAWVEIAPGLKAKCRINRCEVKADSDQVSVVMSFWGGAGYEPLRTKTCTAGTHASLHMWMNQNQYGKQCGHCGDFDGDAGNDAIFVSYGKGGDARDAKQDGQIKKGVTVNALCQADVADCHQMFQLGQVPTQYTSNGQYVPEDATLCGCNDLENKCKSEGETRSNVVTLCKDSYKKVCDEDANPDSQAHKPFFEECVEDVCNGGVVFTEIDVADEEDLECSETKSMNDDAVCRHCKV